MDFLTIKPGLDVHAELEIRRSRFLAVLRRIESQEQARALIDEQRRLHHDARHHCSAFVWQDEGDETSSPVARSSDDGEPPGSAGMPMLQMLTDGPAGPLLNVAAVVSRYFGGTLLGTGGLVRAYSGAVAEVVAKAVTVRRRRLELVELAIDHSSAGRVQSELRARGVLLLGVDYAELAVLTLARSGLPDQLTEDVATVTAGAGVLRPVGFRWVDE